MKSGLAGIDIYIGLAVLGILAMIALPVMHDPGHRRYTAWAYSQLEQDGDLVVRADLAPLGDKMAYRLSEVWFKRVPQPLP